MRFFSSKYLSLLLLAFIYAANAQASYEMKSDDCCRSNYECGNPLVECSWGLQFQAGVRPIVWEHRNHFFTVDCASTTVLNDLGRLPKFSKLYHVPWQVGGQLSYAFSCDTNLFVEFNYAQARFKDKDQCVTFLTKYKLYDGYLGARYYFDRWCNSTAFFIGAKIGFLHHDKVKKVSLVINDSNLSIVPVLGDFFGRNTSFAGGGHVGFDICFCNNWSLVITAEVIASCGPKGINTLNLNSLSFATLDDASAILIPSVETELAFPVTVGLKYNF